MQPSSLGVVMNTKARCILPICNPVSGLPIPVHLDNKKTLPIVNPRTGLEVAWSPNDIPSSLTSSSSNTTPATTEEPLRSTVPGRIASLTQRQSQIHDTHVASQKRLIEDLSEAFVQNNKLEKENSVLLDKVKKLTLLMQEKETLEKTHERQLAFILSAKEAEMSARQELQLEVDQLKAHLQSLEPEKCQRQNNALLGDLDVMRVRPEDMSVEDIDANIVQLKDLLHELEISKREKMRCVVCFEAPSTVILLPCRHEAVCRNCSNQLTECPICRAPIREKISSCRSTL
jgi:hypothetical protein